MAKSMIPVSEAHTMVMCSFLATLSMGGEDSEV